MKQIALITGATSGIGKATAIKLAENNYNIIITGRRRELLETLKTEIENKHGTEVIVLSFDIRKKEEVDAAIDNLTGKWKQTDVLVNNAGLAAGLDYFHEADMNDWEQMIDTNIKGLLYISRKITPAMVQQKAGHIVNIGSISGINVYAKGSVYCSTKFAVRALTEGMRIDLVEHGIKVTAINPGAVDTEFSAVRFKGDSDRAKQVYKGFTPLYAEDIAEAVWFAISRPAHVNINEMLVMPTAQANGAVFHRKEA